MTSECSKLITELTKTRDSSRKSEIISELSETFNKSFNLERCPIVLDDVCLLIRDLAKEIVSPTDDDSLQKCVSIICCLVLKSEMSYHRKLKFAKYFLDVIEFHKNHKRIDLIVHDITTTTPLLGQQFLLEGCLKKLLAMTTDKEEHECQSVMTFVRRIVSSGLRREKLCRLSGELNVLYAHLLDRNQFVSLSVSRIVLELVSGSSNRMDALVTDELLSVVVRFFKKRTPSDVMMMNMMTIFGRLCTCSVQVHARLASFGVASIFRNLFGEYFHARDHLITISPSKVVSTTYLLNSFIPALPKNYKGFTTLYKVEPSLITSEFSVEAQFKGQKDLMRGLFNQVFHALKGNVECTHACHALMLKMIHYRTMFHSSTQLPVDSVTLTRYLNDLMTSSSLGSVALGLAMTKTLIKSFSEQMFSCFLVESLPTVLKDLDNLTKTDDMSHLEMETVDWIRRTASSTLDFIIKECNISKECILMSRLRDDVIMTKPALHVIKLLSDLMENNHQLHLEFTCCEIPGVFLDYIIAPDDTCSDDDLLVTSSSHAEVMNLRYERLRNFVRIVLGLPEDTKSMSIHQLTNACKSGAFSNMVHLTNSCINVDELTNADIADLFKTSPRPSPESAESVDLGLGSCEALDRVLETPRHWTRLRSDSTTRTLRFISILHAVNKNWGVLFESTTKRCLLADEDFVNHSLTAKYRSISNQCCADDDDDVGGDDNDCTIFLREENSHLLRTLMDYPFLVSFDVRRNILHGLLQDRSQYDPKSGFMFHMERKDMLREMSCIIDRAIPGCPWEFQFLNESGTGAGPTKEFYTVLSQDCQRSGLNLWIGDQAQDDSSSEYVFSSTGLFPSPRALDSSSQDLVETIGKVLAKSLMDSRMMDLPLNKTMYKILLTRQSPTIQDVKDVLPSLSNFIDDLADTLRLSEELFSGRKNSNECERKNFLSSLSLNFDDLCIDFTFPGYPEVELVEGGKERLLTPFNIETYLKSLMWHLFYEGPRKKIDLLRRGFKSFMNKPYLDMFYPHEMESLFCGSECMAWSMEHLQENMDFTEGFTVGSQPIKFLLEVLTSVTPKEQRKFIQFTTGYARLPVEGLKALSPRISVVPVDRDDPNLYFPVSMTCANRIFLPRYDSAKVLREKLLGAIREPQTFEYV